MADSLNVMAASLLQQAVTSRLGSWYVFFAEGYDAYVKTIDKNITKLKAALVLEPTNNLLLTELSLQQLCVGKFLESYQNLYNNKKK